MQFLRQSIRRLSTSNLDELASCLRGQPKSGTDWEQIVTMSGDGLVGHYVHEGIIQAEDPARIDAEAAQYFSIIAQANQRRNQMLKSQLEECNAAFVDAGIDIIVIKGGALLARTSDVSRIQRIVGDLDILVAPAEVEGVDTLLLSLGYERILDSEWGHGVGSYKRPDCAASIDVQVRLPDRIASVLDDLDERSETVMLGGFNVRVPDPSFHVLLNVAHEMLHDRGLINGFMELRYLMELDLFLKAYEAVIDWSWIEDKSRDNRLGLSLELQDRMAKRLLGHHLFPQSTRSFKGQLLHTRRVLKANWIWLGDLEWDAISSGREIYLSLRNWFAR